MATTTAATQRCYAVVTLALLAAGFQPSQPDFALDVGTGPAELGAPPLVTLRRLSTGVERIYLASGGWWCGPLLTDLRGGVFG